MGLKLVGGIKMIFLLSSFNPQSRPERTHTWYTFTHSLSVFDAYTTVQASSTLDT